MWVLELYLLPLYICLFVYSPLLLRPKVDCTFKIMHNQQYITNSIINMDYKIREYTKTSIKPTKFHSY